MKKNFAKSISDFSHSFHSNSNFRLTSHFFNTKLLIVYINRILLVTKINYNELQNNEMACQIQFLDLKL